MKIMQFKLRTLLLMFFIATLFSQNARAGFTYHWVGPSTGNWDDACNWDNDNDPTDCDGVPGAMDVVIIDQYAFVTLNSHTEVLSLHLSNVGKLSGNYTFTVHRRRHRLPLGQPSHRC